MVRQEFQIVQLEQPNIEQVTNIIASELNIGTHKKQALALHCALSHHRLIKQASSCG